MNDFTKEELSHLHNLVGQEGWFPDVYAVSSEAHRDYKQKFCDKIQSLIDNYCEHEEFEYEAMSGHFDDRVCTKCGKQERCCK